MCKIIKPQRLSERHSLSLARMSNDNLSKDCKATPETLYGIGKYCSDAYHIFCLGDWKSIVDKPHYQMVFGIDKLYDNNCVIY